MTGARLLDFLGLKRNIALFLAGILLATTGERLWLGFAPKYLETLGAGVLLIGVYDALQTGLGAIYAYPGAWFTDKLGQRKALLLFSALSTVGYLLVLLWREKWALIVGVFFFVAWSALTLPTMFTVVATNLRREKYTMGIGIQSMIRRIPMILGPLAGGWIISRWGWEVGIRNALLLCILLGIATLVLQASLTDREAKHKEAPRPHSFWKTFHSFPPDLKELLVSDILIRFCERIPYAFVVLWVIDRNRLNAGHFGVLTAIEMIVAMLCYIPVAHWSDKRGQRPFVLATFVFFSMFPLVLLFSHTFAAMVVAFAIRGLKEFGEPARKALILLSSPPEARSMSYGVYYLLRDCIVTAGSLLGAWLWSLSPEANLLGATAFGILGTVWFYLSARMRHPRVMI